MTLSNEAQLQTSIIVAASISIVATGSVLLTYFMFPQIRSKRFMKFIFYMSLSDFLVAIMTSFGFPDGGTVLCYIQGPGTLFFTLTSWFWTLCLSYTTYCIVLNGICTVSDKCFHLVVWPLSLLLTFIPFTNATYGTSSNSRIQWCLIVNDSHSPSDAEYMWGYISFFFWLFLCCGCMIFWIARVHWVLYKRKDTLSTAVISIYYRVAWYPLAMIALWIWNYICNEIPAEQSDVLAAVSMLTGVSYGTATAVVFWINSKECRSRWGDILWPVKSDMLLENSVPIDFDEDKLTESYISRISTASRPSVLMMPNMVTGSIAIDESKTRPLEWGLSEVQTHL